VSQAVVASDSYYGSTHPYDANMIGRRLIIFAHRSIQLSDVEKLCSVSTFESRTCCDSRTWSLREYTSDFQTWRHSDKSKGVISVG